MMVALICFVLFYIGCCIAVSKKSRASMISVAKATKSLIDWCLDLFFDVPHYVVRGVVWCGVLWGSVSESVCVGIWRWITRAKLKEAHVEIDSLRDALHETREAKKKAVHELNCYIDKYNDGARDLERSKYQSDEYPNGMAFGQRM